MDFSLGWKEDNLIELEVHVLHPVVLAGGGLGILTGLGDVSNMEISFENFGVAPGLGKGLVTPANGFSRFLEDDIWANLFCFLDSSILSLFFLFLQPLDFLGIIF